MTACMCSSLNCYHVKEELAVVSTAFKFRDKTRTSIGGIMVSIATFQR